MGTYLITGGGGFIGSNLVESLLRSGEHVRVLDDFSTGRRSNLAQTEKWAAEGGAEFRLLEGDIRDPATCARAVDGAEFVLHQAAMPSVPRSIEEPIASHHVNVDGTLNMLEAARRAGVTRFVYASSSSLYGESETLPKVESMPSAPISPYGLQKVTAEAYCALYFRLYGLATVALRYFNVFGPRQNPESQYAAVVPSFITAVKAKRPPIIFGDGEQTRDFTFIGNVIQANLNACRAPSEAFGRAFNVACGERISLNELARKIGELVGNDVEAEHTDPREGDIRHSVAGIDLARRLLAYEPSVDLHEGLRRTLEAY
jgi:UDP-glucose 4-epimerase